MEMKLEEKMKRLILSEIISEISRLEEKEVTSYEEVASLQAPETISELKERYKNIARQSNMEKLEVLRKEGWTPEKFAVALGKDRIDPRWRFLGRRDV